MIGLQEAYTLEREGNALGALKIYEDEFSEGNGTSDDYIRAAFILFVIQDYGFRSEQEIPSEIIDRAWMDSMAYLDIASKDTARKQEVFFWKKYFAYVILGENDFVGACKEYIREGCLMPYVYLINTDTSDKTYVEKASQLYSSVKEDFSFKAQYIKSILQALVDKRGQNFKKSKSLTR